MGVEYCDYCDSFIDLDYDVEHWDDEEYEKGRDKMKCVFELEDGMKSEHPQPIPLDPDPDRTYEVMRATEKTTCDECGGYRDIGEYAVFRKTDTLCSWVCALEISERGVKASYRKYGIDADQMNKIEKENAHNLSQSTHDPGNHKWGGR